MKIVSAILAFLCRFYAKFFKIESYIWHLLYLQPKLCDMSCLCQWMSLIKGFRLTGDIFLHLNLKNAPIRFQNILIYQYTSNHSKHRYEHIH